jgi:hypothetical protein
MRTQEHCECLMFSSTILNGSSINIIFKAISVFNVGCVFMNYTKQQHEECENAENACGKYVCRY